MLVDSHCHLDYLEDPGSKLAAAQACGVTGVLCAGVDRQGLDAVLSLAEANGQVWATAGLHPEAVGPDSDSSWIREAARHPQIVGIGETGLDYYRLDEKDDETRAAQRRVFAEQLSIAGTEGLPVVVHTRAAEADTRDLITAFPGVIGVMHCFTESWPLAAAALDAGYYISISGIVTFKNGDNVREVAKKVPADRLLVETDAPWLAPVPHRGRANEPAYVRDTACYLAELRGISFEQLAAETTANFFRLFQRASSGTNSSSNTR